MWHNLSSFFSEHWGDLASVLGLAGVGIAVHELWKAKTTTERIQQAVMDVKAGFALRSGISDLQHLLTDLTEIKELQVQNAWLVLPRRYDAVRRRLILIRESGDGLSSDQRRKIQSAITLFKKLDQQIGEANRRRAEPDKPEDILKLVSRHSDELYGILVAMERSIGESHEAS